VFPSGSLATGVDDKKSVALGIRHVVRALYVIKHAFILPSADDKPTMSLLLLMVGNLYLAMALQMSHRRRICSPAIFTKLQLLCLVYMFLE